MAGFVLTSVAVLTIFSVIDIGTCRNVFPYYRRDPNSQGFVIAVNKKMCKNACKVRNDENFPNSTCVTDFEWDDPHNMAWKKCNVNAPRTNGENPVFSSRGNLCLDTCSKKGGFKNVGANDAEYFWCVIGIFYQDFDPFDWSRCSPDGGKTTSMGLKCKERCDFYCRCGTGFWKCEGCDGKNAYKTCAVQMHDKWSEKLQNKAGINWDYC